MKTFKEHISENKYKRAYIKSKGGFYYVVDSKGKFIKKFHDLRTATKYLNTHNKELNANVSIAKPTIGAVSPTIGGAPTMAG